MLSSLDPYEKKILSFNRTLNESIDVGRYYFVVVVDEKGKNNDPKQKNNTFVWKRPIVVE